jgi:hypothetical protein
LPEGGEENNESILMKLQDLGIEIAIPAGTVSELTFHYFKLFKNPTFII